MTRRNFLWQYGGGLGGIALAHMSAATHHTPKAKRVVQFFMSGAASQCDSFDYKPMLQKKAGEKWDPGEKVELFQSNPGVVMPCPWEWRQYGQSGKWISGLFPHVATCADDVAFVHSLLSKSNVHGPATFLQSTGFILPGFPSAGSWVSYALGSMNENLPVFVVLPDNRGVPPNGPANWSSGFLPAAHQATSIRVGSANPIHDLFAPEGSFVTASSEMDGLALLEKVNREHLASRTEDSRLDARIKSYEMAARLQLSAPEVLRVDGESDATKKLYGLDDPITEEMGRRCLVARRLLERGVRFVQLWSGADNGFPRRNWDSHEHLAKDHWEMAVAIDKPIAALMKDLKARGLFDDTIVHWTTEFGRMPCSQGSKGRDHNPFGFTNWLAGGGIKGGTSYGATDEWSYKAVDNPCYGYDVHATMLHLLGIDHTRLTYRHNGIDRRLTDVHGNVLREIVA
ncbi:MAG: DUF1501 domain-containing protein [Acidobacteria bacterium]|nr:DUF1501 domain-containing protein [Acidobacteriota bacterium]